MNHSIYTKFIFLCSILILFSCWKKQHHEITKPAAPSYAVTGTLVDTDSRQPLSNGKIQLDAVQQLYDCDISVFADSTDSLGKFQFSSVCPGFYNISIWRDTVLTTMLKFELKHGDTTLVLDSPKVLRARLKYESSDLTGLAWKNVDSLAFISLWHPAYDQNAELMRIFAGSFLEGFHPQGPYPFANENPPLKGLVWADSVYLSFSGGLDNPTMNILDPLEGKVIVKLQAPHRLVDLAYDGTFLWATSTRLTVIKWNIHKPSSIDEYPTPGNHPKGLAWDGRHFWSSDDGELARTRLYQHGDNFSVLHTFIPVYYKDANSDLQTLKIDYMTFNSEGDLWAIGDSDEGEKGIFRILTP